MTKKGPYCNPFLKTSQHGLERGVEDNLNNQKKLNNKNIAYIDSEGIIYTTSRSSTILPEFVGRSFAVYNGKEYKTFGKITPEHVGKKFGEFSSTKKPAIYKKKK